ncbi:MAG: SusC/RagA family TonB-linked outer membrane protein [Bacteroidales bacterium]|nr:SusC/RagA family TonB-linked outer membrane protein [Bacteroidales bacterium]
MRKFFTLAILASMIALPLGAAQTQGEASSPSVQNPVTTITGIVTDAAGVPVPGATVAVQGTTNGTQTDSYGRFSLNAPVGATLEVQCLGYAPRTVAASAGTMSISLEEDIEMLNEAVAIGYGSVRKSDLTGSVAIIGSDKFKDLPQGGVTNILQGKVAGVNITSVSGDGSKAIRIRGITSINKSNEPLWVVDGVIGGTVQNFYEIENIEVLKDASATAIYGTQGANGVILVTTKRPQEGVHVTFDARYSTSNFRYLPEFLSPYEYAYSYNSLHGEAVSAADVAAFQNGTNKGVDWIDYCFRPSFSQGYNLNITGGSPKIKYGVMGSFSDGHGQIKNSRSRSYSAKSTLQAEITPWLTFRGYAYGSTGKSYGNGFSFNDVIGMSSIMEVQNEEGVYNRDPYGTIGSSAAGALYGRTSESRSSSFQGYANFIFTLMPGLTFSTEGLFSDSHSYSGSLGSHVESPGTQSSASFSMGGSYSWRNINTLNYTQDFGDHHLNLTAGLELTQGKSWSLSSASNGLSNEALGFWNIAAADTKATGNGFSNSAMTSVLGRAVYSYMDKYSVTATLRGDACSQFRDKYKWGYFPSIAAAWNVEKEDFIDNTKIQQLKLRVSYGTIGNNGVGAYTTFSTLVGETSRGFLMGFWPGTSVNLDVHWEKTRQFNVGFDLSVLDRRLNFTADAYLKKTTDLLFLKDLPDYNGGGSVWTNIGDLSNRGLEFTLNAIPVSTRDFNWETTFTASYNRTRVDDLGPIDYLIPDSDRGGLFGGGLFILKKGANIGTFYLTQWAGFDENGNNLFYNVDANGKKDGTTTTKDLADNRVLIGKGIPDWIFGWQNTLRWRNWDFSALFRFTSQYDRLDIARYKFNVINSQTRHVTTKDGWYRAWNNVKDKSNALYANLYSSNNVNTPRSTQFLEKAAFIRLQNLTLGYQIPQKLTGKVRIHLSASAENLFVLSGYKGLDPETVSETGPSTFGLDNGVMPMPRTFIGIVRFEF